MLSRVKPLEPNTLQVEHCYASTTIEKIDIIRGVIETFHNYSQESEIGFKRFNPLASKYADLRENDPSLE